MSRLKKSFVASLYFSVANYLTLFIQIGAFLHFWGAERYGVWVVINTIPSCISFSDGGVGNALGNRLTETYQRRDFDGARVVLASVWFCQLRVLLALLALFTLVAFAFPFEQWLQLSAVSHFSFALVSTLIGLSAAFTLQASLLSATARAAGRYDQFVNLSAHLRMVECAGVCAALYWGGGYLAVSLVTLGIRGGYMLALWLMARRLLPEVTVSSSAASWTEFFRLVPSGLSFLSFSLGGGVINQGTTLAANHIFGPSAVALINVCRQLARVYVNLTSIAFTAIQPEVNYLLSNSQHERAAVLQRRALGATMCGAPFFIGVIAFAGPWGVAAWTGGAMAPGLFEMMLFGIEATLMAIGNMAVITAWSTNRTFEVARVYIWAHLAALGLVLLCGRYGGIRCVPVVFSVAGAFYMLASIQVTARILGTTGWRLVVRSLTVRELVSPVFRVCRL
jgi:O-antigen/teichoic acid export membrane protein